EEPAVVAERVRGRRVGTERRGCRQARRLALVRPVVVAAVRDRTGRTAETLDAEEVAVAPATCGLAMEVPLMYTADESLLPYDDGMFTPGANRSTQGPTLDHEARASCTSVAPTVIASAVSAGDLVHALTGFPYESPLPAATVNV